MAVSLMPELRSPELVHSLMGGICMIITDEDRAEFAVVQKMPVYDRRRRAYLDIESYVADRSLFFGGTSAYRAFSAESDEELASTQWVRAKRTRTLRSMIEFNKKHEERKQQIFFRWVRKAYREKYGPSVNVPELIRRGMSQELADKIASIRGSVRVKGIKQEKFRAGGFNPRPIKYNHHYLLGTLSEHGTGMAVDIEDKDNPQFTLAEWDSIQKIAGRAFARSGRWKTEAAAEALWKDFKLSNDQFTANVKSGIQRIEKERAQKAKADEGRSAKPPAASLPSAQRTQTPIREVLGAHHEALSPWVSRGFLCLPLDLVLELHAQGFVWGATFGSNVDLHHFELPE